MHIVNRSSRERLVVIGNGMAGIACLERAPDRFDVTVFSAEARPDYDRIQLYAAREDAWAAPGPEFTES